MRIDRRIISIILIALTFFMGSCKKEAELCPLELYSERYNKTAEQFGFEGSTVRPSESGVCGFAAFDGLFIVCLCTTQEDLIHTADISTGSEYSKLIRENRGALEKAALSAAYLILPLYKGDVTDDDVSELAGMILAAIDGEKIEIGNGAVMAGKKTTAGGFELTVTLMEGIGDSDIKA